jgi:lipopolysaccharide export system protein LptC
MLGGATLVGALALFSDPFTGAPPAQKLPDELADEPDLYIKDATITQFRPNGQIKYRLLSPHIRHFERNDLTRLTAPRLTLHNNANPPWEIESETGYIRRRAGNPGPPEEVVFLRRDVVLEQRYDDGRRVHLETPSLYIYPDRSYAETEQNVMIDTDVGRTTAVGLQGDLQRGLLNLSSSAQQRVHTIVLPGQFK